MLRKNKYLVCIPPIISNTLIIPWVLKLAYQVPDLVPFMMLTVGIGEILAVGVLGNVLLFALDRYRNVIFQMCIRDRSMPTGQYEAAEVLGYSRVSAFFKIILPQVIKRILPAVTNEVITLVKDTSLAYTISVLEMFNVAKSLSVSQTSMMPLVAAGIFYYIFNLLVAFIMERAEKKMAYYR